MRISTIITAALLAASGLVAEPAPAHANALGPAERTILAAFNICWTAETGGNLAKLATDAGFAPPPQAKGSSFFYRDAVGSVIFLFADFGPGADGAPEPACRITAIKPQLDTPYTPRQPILLAPGDLIDLMVRETANMGTGYRVITLRQPHPRRPGRTRTLLRSDQGARARMIYIEESAKDYEFLYAHGSRAVIHDPATADIGTDPTGRVGMQAFVDDRWQIAFCDLNPHACLTPQQQRQLDQQALARARDSKNWTLPFSGIGSAAGNGDNRSNEQKSRDKAWWENYHRCGRGKC